MIHFKFTRKNVRRLCVTMALIAPIIYLFGSLFTGLNGAHGVFPFVAEDDIPVSTRLVNYSQLIDGDFVEGDNPFSGIGSGVSTSYGEDGLSVSFSAGSYYYQAFRVAVNLHAGHYYCVRLVERNYDGRLYYSPSLFQSYATNSVFRADYEITSVRFGPYDVSEAYSVLLRSLMIFDLTYMYGSGNEPTYEDFVNDFPDEYYAKGTYEGYLLHDYAVPNASQYVFNQFFAKDNFLSQIGADSVSSTPHGFAPFGSLFRYIDQNVLHMADTQVGLMAYGYLYWCAHVLLFDVLFMMTTFFISFIERVGDRLGGNE